MTTLRIAARIPCTEAEGPFRRYALWVQGCSLRCPGCCNPGMFAPDGGDAIGIETLAAEIRESASAHAVEGVTVLGGEPLEQAAALAQLASSIQALGLGVIVFTGFERDEAQQRPGFEQLWPAVDTLVTGRFDRAAPEQGPDARRYIGSRNQVLHHRTPRYDDASLWRGANHAEIRVAPDGTVTVHGFPSETPRILHALRRRESG